MTRPSGREPGDGRRSFLHRYGRKIAVAIGGLLVLVAGAFLALPGIPGPGILVMVAGLALLATEFDWAERWLHRAREYAERTARRTGVDLRWAIVVTVVVFVGLAAAWWFLFMS